MGVYIPKMEMPKICEECPCFDEEFYYCNVKKENLSERLFDHTTDPPPNWCPLVEIPPHGDLIDIDRLLLEVNNLINSEKGILQIVSETEKLIRNAPIIIESEE